MIGIQTKANGTALINPKQISTIVLKNTCIQITMSCGSVLVTNFTSTKEANNYVYTEIENNRKHRI